MTMKVTDFRAYIKEKTDRETSCWIWTGWRNALGYGISGNVGGFQLAHRLSYSVFKGPIPKGLCVLHKCDVPQCVNPTHLYAGTKKDNMRDIRKRHPERLGKGNPKRDFCKRGHPRTRKNLYKDSSCILCKKITNRKLEAKWKLDAALRFRLAHR